eukprot:6360873-Ditylum_brightwellii.AAC.1
MPRETTRYTYNNCNGRFFICINIFKHTNRGIPLVAGLERHVKRSRHGTVQEDNPEESDSNDGDDLDKDDN